MFIFYMYVTIIIFSLVAYSYQNLKFSLQLKKQAAEVEVENYYSSSFYKNLIKIKKVVKREELEEITTFFNKIYENIEIFSTLEKVEKREKSLKKIFYFSVFDMEVKI